MRAPGYSVSVPENQQATYAPSSLVVFKLRIPDGYSLVRNSLWFKGDFQVSANAAIPLANGNVYVDPAVGMHGVVRYISIKTSVTELSLDDVQFYPRLIAGRSAGEAEDSAGMSLLKMCAGITSDPRDVIYGPLNDPNSGTPPMSKLFNVLGTYGQAAGTFSNRSFAFRPVCALNLSDSDIPSERIGSEISLTFSLSSNQQLFYGAGAGTATYQLANLYLHYRVTKTPLISQGFSQKHGKASTAVLPPTTLYHYSSDQFSVPSSTSIYQFSVVSRPLDSLFLNFISQTALSDPEVDSNSLMPLVAGAQNSIQLYVNDSTDVVTFPLDSAVEIAKYFLEALGVDLPQAAVSNPAACFAIGYRFRTPLPVGSRVRLVITSGVTSDQPFQGFAYRRHIQTL